MKRILNIIRVSLSVICNRVPILARFAPLFYPGTNAPTHFYGLPQSDHLIIFVHGFTGDPRLTWIHHKTRFNFPQELSKDINNSYIVCFGYSTCLETGPSILSIADHLEFEISELLKAHQYRTVRFVAHSMGGLIAREYILRRQPHVHPQVSVTHLVLLGTPTNGSELAELRLLVPKNRQVEEMRHIDTGNSYLESLNKDWNRAFKAEGLRSRHIIFFAAYEELSMLFVGKAVRLSSAVAYADESIGFQTNHFNIAKPQNREDRIYKWVKAKLKQPNPDVFEIESFDMEVKVQPLDAYTAQEVRFGRHGRSKTVVSDNKAEVKHTVKFSLENLCKKPYKLRYRTRQDGAVIGRASHTNIADAQELGLHDDYGSDHLFKFIPDAGSTYSITWEVYRGFDPGNRDIHFHFNKPETQSHCHHFVLRLDLTAYINAGFTIAEWPTLYFRPQESSTCDECAKVLSTDPERPVLDELGRWKWHLEDIREGVLTVRWDLKEQKNEGH